MEAHKAVAIGEACFQTSHTKSFKEAHLASQLVSVTSDGDVTLRRF